ncbi:hypothetical protein N836_33290 [Leptolyngbya sp. Heron Island J]|uniref:phage tail protein n=1 Tax=Leptolyngbya sp. Heron Island J TaxID=1385935 RepID=UPI0003B986A1|nr:phage tail protein [Leptolyngbya sp. Heron Island J]ESA38306.1 hypothetical protein N836_33290 [Leptolyngbya sp. Heron Island J]
MKTVTALQAKPHLAGHRIDLSWQNPLAAEFEPGISLVGIQIVRRQRTFTEASDIGGDGELLADGQIVYNGAIISHFSDQNLSPQTTYYYTLFTLDSTGSIHTDLQARVACFSTQNYNLATQLYKLLPAVHQRYDTPLDAAQQVTLQTTNPALAQALDTLPPQLKNRGQLWRFLQATASPLDMMRSLAEGLPQLHQPDIVRPEFLPALAQWMGWDLDQTLPLFSQRNEVQFAPHLYRQVSTIPSLRSLVTRYTGWYTQVAEFEQQIIRTNLPAQLNIFALVAGTEPNQWHSPTNAALALGFIEDNASTTGTASTAAQLTSTASEPFVLTPGMELTITADGRVPNGVTFLPGDFVDMGAAVATEVVAVLNRTFSEVTATAVDGQIRLQSHTVGDSSALQIGQSVAALVSLEGAPRGRLSPVTDSLNHLRLFYETVTPLTEATTAAALQQLQGNPIGSIAGETATPNLQSSPYRPATPQGEIHYKSFRSGQWGEAQPLTHLSEGAAGHPTAVVLPDDRLWVAWVRYPDTASGQLEFILGQPAPPQPARLVSQKSGPYTLSPGMSLVFRVNGNRLVGVQFSGADLSQATAEAVRTVLNTQLTSVSAVAENGRLVLETPASGGDQRLELVLSLSSAAAALGFDQRNSVATGTWGDAITWQPVTATGDPGRHSDLAAVVAGDGRVWLFWSTHTGRRWSIVTAQWNSAAPPETAWSPIEPLAETAGGNREPYAILDTANRIWLFWSQRQVGSGPESWTLRRRVFDPGTTSWGPEVAVTVPPPVNSQVRDLTPQAIRLEDNNFQLFFQSNRNGGSDLWSATVIADPTNTTPIEPVAITTGPTLDSAPAPVQMPEGALWLLYRSDRSVSLSQIANRPMVALNHRIIQPNTGSTTPNSNTSQSFRRPDTGTLKRFAGANSIVLADIARIQRQRQWDDLLSYTPQKPDGGLLANDDLYTRGTIGLYLSRTIPDSPLSREKVERLKAVLENFLPINVRVVVILAPRVDIEYLYPPGEDIEERYQDQYPFVDYYSGLTDATDLDLPDWVLLLSNSIDQVSADPTDLTTLRDRTHFPPYLPPNNEPDDS